MRIMPAGLSIFLFLLFSSFQKPHPAIKFRTRHHHFGFVRQGAILNYDYEFTNSGLVPVLIQAAETECSCTKAEFPPLPVQPGQEAHIHLEFDSKKAIGRQDRTILIYSNSIPSPLTLRFKCIVLKKKE
jgi:hypothetical protein